MSDWRDVGRALGMSRETARQIGMRALEKLRQRHPDLVELLAAALRVGDRRSLSQQVIDEAPYESQSENPLGGWRWNGRKP